MIIRMKIDTNSITKKNWIDNLNKIITNGITTATDSAGNKYPTNLDGLKASGTSSRIFGDYPTNEVWEVATSAGDSVSYLKRHSQHSNFLCGVLFTLTDTALTNWLIRAYDSSWTNRYTEAEGGNLQAAAIQSSYDLTYSSADDVIVAISDKSLHIEVLTGQYGNGQGTFWGMMTDFGLTNFSGLTGADSNSIMIGLSTDIQPDGSWQILGVPYKSTVDGTTKYQRLQVNPAEIGTEGAFEANLSGVPTFMETPVYAIHATASTEYYGAIYMYGLKKIANSPYKRPGGVLTTSNNTHDCVIGYNSLTNCFVVQGA